MKKVTIGDKVVYSPWGNQPNRTANITGIEICQVGYKYGRKVNNCDLDKHREGVLDLSDEHWIYFNQVRQVISNHEQDKDNNDEVLG
jgi:hypothetical protein